MSDTKQMWREKSDEELRHAADHPLDYTPTGRQIILAELARRGMPASAKILEHSAKEDPLNADTSVKKRYQDGYRASNTIVGVGNAIKITGIITALAIVVAGVSIFGMRARSIATVFIIAALIAIFSFAFGVLVSALGQILRAGLDVAVYSSTFLEDKDRAAVMGLDKMTDQ